MNVTIPIECQEGHLYLLELNSWKDLPVQSDIEVIDLALVTNDKISIINNPGTLNKIASILFDFLEENDVILYFYCSKSSINKSIKKENISNQQYRSILFSRMYDRVSTNYPSKYIHKPIILEDPEDGDHYIHLIAKKRHDDKLEAFEKEFDALRK